MSTARLLSAALLTLVTLVTLATLATQVQAQSLQVIGYSGRLGEWELSADVTGTTSGRVKAFSGPLTLRHVGICTTDGSEQKTGEIRLQLSHSRSVMEATLWLDGAECRYSGRLAGRYTGSMDCPGRPAVPVTLWLK
ncbi:MAG: hypothetical protein ABJA77_19255 [Variovorax sp.]